MVRNPGDLCFAEEGRDGVLCAGDDDFLCFWGPEIGQAAIGERIRMRVDIQFGAGLAVIGTVYNSTGQEIPGVFEASQGFVVSSPLFVQAPVH